MAKKPRKSERTERFTPDERIAGPTKTTAEPYVPLAESPPVEADAVADAPGESLPAPAPRDRSIHQAISFTTGNVPLDIEMLPISEKLRLLHLAGEEREDRESWQRMVSIGHKLLRHAAYSVKQEIQSRPG